LRILVTGSRDWDDWAPVSEAFTGICGSQVTVVHGGARGADEMADTEASLRGCTIEIHRADWNKHGRAAGLIRNREMVDAGADICLAFIRNKSRGATHCADYAESRGIPVRRFIIEDAA
jgi:hypothetical protein